MVHLLCCTEVDHGLASFPTISGLLAKDRNTLFFNAFDTSGPASKDRPSGLSLSSKVQSDPDDLSSAFYLIFPRLKYDAIRCNKLYAGYQRALDGAINHRTGLEQIQTTGKDQITPGKV